ncbi:MAG: SRPBCC family protein [Alphaproteobacteria bacterium]
MIEVRVSGRIGAPAACVWAVIGDFNGLAKWVPGIRASSQDGSGVGAVRHLDISARGGQWVTERLESFDSGAYSLSYCIVDGSLPLKNYLSTMRLADGADGRSCTLDWRARFEAKDATDEDAERFVRRAYEAGLDSLRTTFGD